MNCWVYGWARGTAWIAMNGWERRGEKEKTRGRDGVLIVSNDCTKSTEFRMGGWVTKRHQAGSTRACRGQAGVGALALSSGLGHARIFLCCEHLIDAGETEGRLRLMQVQGDHESIRSTVEQTWRRASQQLSRHRFASLVACLWSVAFAC